jgi:hypothetical protein
MSKHLSSPCASRSSAASHSRAQAAASPSPRAWASLSAFSACTSPSATA